VSLDILVRVLTPCAVYSRLLIVIVGFSTFFVMFFGVVPLLCKSKASREDWEVTCVIGYNCSAYVFEWENHLYCYESMLNMRMSVWT